MYGAKQKDFLICGPSLQSQHVGRPNKRTYLVWRQFKNTFVTNPDKKYLTVLYILNKNYECAS